MKLEIRLFRFDAKHDYLPSYQPFIYNATSDCTILDLLNHHKQNDPLFRCNLSNVYGVKVNGYACALSTKLSDLSAKTTDLTIEPLDTARATLDLEIDTSDFDEQFLKFGEFVDGTDSSFYNQYIAHHYASPVRKIDDDYLGIAGFMLISRLLDKNPANKPKLFEIAKKGKICAYDGTKTIFNDAEQINDAIIKLQGEAGIKPKNNTIFPAKNLPNLSNKNIALVCDEHIDLTPYQEAIKSSGATLIKLSPSANSGAKIFNETIAKKLAENLMTEAFDSGCDLVACADLLSYSFLNKTFKKPIIEILSFAN